MAKRNGAPPPLPNRSRDELDRARAARFAWRGAITGQLARLSPDDLADPIVLAARAASGTAEEQTSSS
jgi:hypothetical protein